MRQRQINDALVSRADPRPDDMVELARLTAIELRKRGILAECEGFMLVTQRFVGKRMSNGWLAEVSRYYHNLHLSDFDSLGPVGCADHIQAEESRRARGWAGDA